MAIGEYYRAGSGDIACRTSTSQEADLIARVSQRVAAATQQY